MKNIVCLIFLGLFLPIKSMQQDFGKTLDKMLIYDDQPKQIEFRKRLGPINNNALSPQQIFLLFSKSQELPFTIKQSYLEPVSSEKEANQ